MFEGDTLRDVKPGKVVPNRASEPGLTDNKLRAYFRKTAKILLKKP